MAQFSGRVVLCGGGNAAHVMAVLLQSRGYLVTLFTLPDEAASFRDGMAPGGLSLVFAEDKKQINIQDLKVTSSGEEAGVDADIALLALPAFAHGHVLCQLAPFLKEGITVGAIPSRSGFEYQAHHILQGAGLKKYSVFAAHTLPWACRIASYGRRVDVLGVKNAVSVAAMPARYAKEVAEILTDMFAVTFNPLPNTMTVSLGNVGQVIHPGIMYGLLHDYNGEIWQESDIPLFYQGVDAFTAKVLAGLSGELVNLARRLETLCPDLELGGVQEVGEWLFSSYPRSITDTSSLQKAFNTNSSYAGLKVPVRSIKGGFVPDFHSRYLTEDVPFGLLFSKAVASLAGVSTPFMDEVILWSSKVMGVEYLKAGRLEGSNISQARIPCNYGITSLGQMCAAGGFYPAGEAPG
jgi:hypothetical protein